MNKMKRLLLQGTALAVCAGIFASAQVIIPPAGSGGGGTPGGSNTQLQYNNSSAFGGISTLTWNGSTLTDSQAGALSASAMTFTGAPITGGTATTTFPLLYLNQGSTAVTSFSTNGTEIGVNAPSGFTGLLVDMYVNGGSSLFNINSSGNGGVGGSWFVGTSENVQTSLTFAGATGAANIINGVTGNLLINSAASAITLSGGGLGTSPSITNNSTAAMDITVGTSPSAATFTITFPVAAAHGWICTGADITTNSTSVFILKQTGAQSTTTCVMGIFTDVAVLGNAAASDHLRIMSLAY